VLTLTRQKEPTGEFLPNPPSPDRHGCAHAQKSLTAQKTCLLAGATGSSLGVCQLSPPVCRLSGAASLARSRPQLAQVLRHDFAVWPSATHEECSASTRFLQFFRAGRNKALFRSIPQFVTWLGQLRQD
jgi:hypothetical protein